MAIFVCAALVLRLFATLPLGIVAGRATPAIILLAAVVTATLAVYLRLGRTTLVVTARLILSLPLLLPLALLVGSLALL